ncbi:aldo/keto reductase [soil metagenome]
MKRRTLGKTGIDVSEIGFGAWGIGDAWGDLVPEPEAKAALHAALDAGMNFIDTADVYGAGRSETLIGQVLSERPADPRIYVATKMGRGPGWKDSYHAVKEAAQRACERLGVDSLDLVQLHCVPTETLKAGYAFEQLEGIKEEGLIKHWGVSVETIEEGLFCIKQPGCASLQVIFNLFRQRVVADLLGAARQADVGILARVPLASGLLTGKFTAATTFPPDDHRHFNANGEQFNVGETFAGVPFEKGVHFAQALAEIMAPDSPNATLAQKSLRWILDHDAVTTVIPGAKSPDQARQNAAAADLPRLATDTHEHLQTYYRTNIDRAVRGAY